MTPSLRIAGVLLALAACKDLPALEQGVCGNAVIETGEECDSFAPPGMRCTGSGEPHPCRFSCTALGDAGQPSCPPGWGCSQADGVCRQPSGEFVPTGAPIAAGAQSVAMGDFDGDGRMDVLTRAPADLIDQARPHVHYFDSQGAVAFTRLVTVPMTSPVIVNVDGDCCDDLVTGVGGLLTWLGTRDRQLLPVAAPSFQIDSSSVRMIPVDTPSSSELFALTVVGESTKLVNPGRQDVPAPVIGDASRFGQLAGEPARGAFVEDSYACTGFALAFRGEMAVTVYSPCQADAKGKPLWASALGPVLVQLPDNTHGVEDGVFTTDLNGDGHLDLLISVLGDVPDGPPQPRVVVAYGDGLGHFSSDATSGLPDDRASPAYWSLGIVNESGRIVKVELSHLPLAAGELSGDAFPDFVMTGGILLSVYEELFPYSRLYYVDQARGLRDPWTQAVVADFNGNGHNDVIAASAGSYDLDYYNGTGLPIMAESSIPTQGKVSRIAVADFDGDLAADVLYSQLGDGRDSLYVAFGRAAGPPETPVKITEIDPVADLLVMGSLLLQAPVAVLSLPKKGGALVSILLNYERLLLAPSLFSVASTGDHLPLVLTAGPLTGAGRIDVAAVAIDLDALQLETPVQSLDLWAALGAGGPPGKPVRLSSGVVFDSDELPLSMAWADVDGDGHPEMALVSVKGVNLATGANDPKGGTLRLGRLAVASMAWTDLGRVDLDFTPTPDGKLAFADLDGDGRPDLVLANGEETQVLWNDGKGQFAGDAVSSIPGARSFAIYRDRSGGAPWVVFVTSDSVQKVQGVPRPASPAPPANALQPTAALYPLPGTESVLTNATGVAIGDVDGDGIDDLAVVDDQHLRILRGKAVLP